MTNDYWTLSSEVRNVKTARVNARAIQHYRTPKQLYQLVNFCTNEHKRFMMLEGEFPRWQLGYIYQAANRLKVRDRVMRRGNAQELTTVCGRTRTDGHQCRAVKMPGEDTCWYHRPSSYERR